MYCTIIKFIRSQDLRGSLSIKIFINLCSISYPIYQNPSNQFFSINCLLITCLFDQLSLRPIISSINYPFDQLSIRLIIFLINCTFDQSVFSTNFLSMNCPSINCFDQLTGAELACAPHLRVFNFWLIVVCGLLGVETNPLHVSPSAMDMA